MTSDKPRRRSFQPSDLDMIEMDFNIMLATSNILGEIFYAMANAPITAHILNPSVNSQ